EEAADEIAAFIAGSNMVFITAGMGGGTGTGAAPVVARIARDQGVLTVGVVTKPFQFEGTHRMRLAESGLKELQEYVDTLIIIPNQNLFRIANERTTFADAFRMADEVLHCGVRGITDLMVKPGLINLDFADIRTVMREMGKAMMGTGEATGDRRAVQAAEAAISNPLLDDVSLKGAKAALINITGGPDMTLFEVDEAANRIREEVDPDANIIFGSAFNNDMEGRLRVSVVATGIDSLVELPSRPQINPIEHKKPYLFTGTRADGTKQPARAEFKPAPAASPPVYAAAAAVSPPPPPVSYAPPVAAPKPEPVLYPAGDTSPDSAMHPTEHAPAQAPVSPPPASTAPADHPTLAPRREQRDYMLAEAEETPIRSLFSRLAEVSRSLTPKPEYGKPEQDTRTMQVTQRPRPEIARAAAPASEEQQFLEIPAFLRRQAN
ncbi:MAG: cell division protein FtsZ, partial [Alphaproteobacteria bacterium]|nr:cell division protein FtsZ [Alphaproteobacteria bacterium]